MFAHGADPKKFELRATEIKGALRFWFRAALGSKIQNNIKALRAVESYIFGDTSRKSKIILSVEGPSIGKSTPLNSNSHISIVTEKEKISVDTAKYIAYGAFEPANKKMKKEEKWCQHLDVGNFEIKVAFFSRDEKEIEDLNLLSDDLMHLMSLFGGIGAKSDKGFGSFSIDDFPFHSKDDVYQTTTDLVENIWETSRRIFERAKGGKKSKEYEDFNFESKRFKSLPTYPVIDLNKKISMGFFPLEETNLKNALGEIGKKYYVFRRKLEPDGAFRNSYKNSSYKAKRAMLGLPILYQIPNQTPKPSVALNNNMGRKASPLKMSVKKENDKYYLVYIFLPAMIGTNNTLAIERTKVGVSADFDNLFKEFKDIWEGN